MKKLNIILFILCLHIGVNVARAQLTPEQQKQVEEAQKQADEAQRKAMEMMENNPQYQEAMKMMQQAEEQRRQELMMEQLEVEKRQKDAAREHMKDFYWRNKVASDKQGKFAEWSWGEVEIAYYDGKGKRGQYGNIPYESYALLGTISADGEVRIDLPPKVQTNRTISTGLFPQMHEILNDEVTFSNPEAPFLWYSYTLDVLKGGNKIGILYMGNSERTTHNLASPADMKYGDEGYLLYWAYSGAACKANYSKNDPTVNHIEGEISKSIDQYTRVDLDFKPGWNLVKIEINGNHLIGQRTRWKWKMYSTIEKLPADARYYFKYEN